MDYSADYASGGNGIGMLGLFIYVAIIALVVASMWMVFTKAGKPGWAAIGDIHGIADQPPGKTARPGKLLGQPQRQAHQPALARRARTSRRRPASQAGREASCGARRAFCR